jgi:hypothetical protein
MLPPSPTMKMVATGSSQTLIYFYQIIWQNMANFKGMLWLKILKP